MLCEEGMTIIVTNSTHLVPHNNKWATPPKKKSNIGKSDKHYTNCGMNNHNVETCKKKGAYQSGSHKGNTTKSKTVEDIFICMPHLWFEWT